LQSKEFTTKVNALNKKKWNFVRASLLLAQAMECKDCEPNVAMLLLCSCADAMQLVGGKDRSHVNFKRFYMGYCPNGLRNPPIEYYLDGKPTIYTASFEEALDCIYEIFRCLYVHKGIAHLELPKGLNDFRVISELEKIKDRYYVIDLLKILDWFVTITKESLYKILEGSEVLKP
jgi:hypothetical protein